MRSFLSVCWLLTAVAGFTSSPRSTLLRRPTLLLQQSKESQVDLEKEQFNVQGDAQKDSTIITTGNITFSDQQIGVLVLATVPVVWGSYVPVVKGLYEIDPPLPGFVFSTAYFAVAAVSAFSLLSLQTSGDREDDGIALKAGWELGFYLFLGNSLQVLGLKSVPSDRAGFLVQLTTIIVPIVQAVLLGSMVSGRTWIACVLALAGITIMGYDGDITAQMMESFSLPSLTQGDLLILSAAVVYSLHVVRLGRWAKETSPLKLVAYKASTELVLSIFVLLLLTTVAPSSTDDIVRGAGLMTFAQETGLEIATFFATIQDRISSGTLTASSVQIAVSAVLWTGLVSTAYTTFAQSFGQQRVKPADANLIYSLQPIFTAVFAYFLLGETMGMYGFVGGSVIGGAVLLAASQSTQSSQSCNDEKELP